MANADWIKIKNEYINTNISQRKLADKYKVSFNTLKAKANKERWAAERENAYHKNTAKVQQEISEKIVAEEVDRISNILKTADVMQDKINESLEQLTVYVDMFGKSHKGDVIDVTRLRKLVSALKDIKDICALEAKTAPESGNLDNLIEGLKDE